MSITIRISVIAALLIAVSNAVPQRDGETNHHFLDDDIETNHHDDIETNHQLLDDDIETNHQFLDDDALSVLCSKLDKATLRSASETSQSMRAMAMSRRWRDVITDAGSNGAMIREALAKLWENYDVEPVSLNEQLTRRVLTERYKSAEIVSKEEREFLMQLLPDHGKKMIPIVLLHRLFRSFVESSDPLLAARNFNDLDHKDVCQNAIEHQISLLSEFQYEEQPHDPNFDNNFFRAFQSYLELSSGGLLRDFFDGIPEPIPEHIVHELTRGRENCDNFCNPGYASLKYAELLLQLGADPFGDGSEDPPLLAACWMGSIGVVNELFLFTGSPQLLIRVMSSDNENVLHRLACCGNCQVSAEIGRLIFALSPDAKGMITAIDSSDFSPLYSVTFHRNPDLLSLYLHILGNLDHHLFVQLMQTAISNCHHNIVRLLLPFGREWLLVDLDLRERMFKYARGLRPGMGRKVIRLINDSQESEFVDQ